MADLKPLGSEKLRGDEKIQRILQLTYYGNESHYPKKDPSSTIVESKSGGVYGIIKEKDGYYVKRGINESKLDYIGGMFMKNKNRFRSYAEALKRLELLKGQEDLQESKKYVLKTKKGAPPPVSGDSQADFAPPADLPPQEDLPPEEGLPPADGEDLPLPDPDGGEFGDEGEGKKSDYMSEIQKYAGKLGQELRDQRERMESDDVKYVLNMVISAVDLDELTDDDIEEIGKRFERDEDFEDESGSFDDVDAEEPLPEPEEDMGEETDPFADLESPSEEVDLSSYADISETGDRFGDGDSDELLDLSKYDGEFSMDGDGRINADDEDEVVEIDLDEIKSEIDKSVKDTLSKYFE